MNLTFQEKSLWIMGASMIATYTWYFWHALQNVKVNIDSDHITLLVASVLMVAVIAIVGHVLVAIVEHPSQFKDERHKLIALYGARNGGVVLGAGVLIAIGSALEYDGNFVFIHVVFAFLVLAELVGIGTQLFLYRRLS